MAVLGTLAGLGAGLAVLVADEPPSAISPGDLVSSDHLTAGCESGEVAIAMNPAGLAGSPLGLAKMVQAHCKAIAPDTRLQVIAPPEKGAMPVQLVGGIAQPLFVMASDFAVLPARR
ncbi:MAG: hypothetical protein ACRYGC_02080 [Janthinobacterium lividum]